MIMAAMFLKSPDAAETIVHIWYSAFLKADMLKQLRSTVLPMINDVCLEIRDESSETLHAETLTSASCSLRLLLDKATWLKLPSYFEVPDGLTKSIASNIRKKVTLDPKQKDYREWKLFVLPPKWRLPYVLYHQDGILLPFQGQRELFDTPNP